ncbi:lactate utilization protein [Hyphomicrobium sp. D-2]|uniref:LutC/YkgG family protein n=1 Tax=Hyphomicrobium sp. D-2 TaxID=3041621 RepID=UPI002457D2CE|nr:lactate utilization protein [Hyphomicrobium sp. D-2]MDH4982244.1 lactate utilization protein [Hyphomicrobium sp. D-2]
MPSETARAEAVAERIAHPPQHWPLRSIQTADPEGAAQLTLIGRFKAQLARLGADVIEVGSVAEIPAALANYVAANVADDAAGLARIRMGSDAFLAALPWSSTSGLEIAAGMAEAADVIGVSRAIAGVAETGTLLLVSGAENPVTLGYLPETHIVVLETGAIVASYEEAMQSMLAATGGRMPRTVNLITGASRTGDIGGKIVMGAHGPRRVAVVLWSA